MDSGSSLPPQGGEGRPSAQRVEPVEDGGLAVEDGGVAVEARQEGGAVAPSLDRNACHVTSSRRQGHLDEARVQGLVGQPVLEADRRVVVPEGGAVGRETAQELAVGVVREALEEAVGQEVGGRRRRLRGLRVEPVVRPVFFGEGTVLRLDRGLEEIPSP